MKPRRVRSETRSSMRSRRRRVTGCSDMMGRKAPLYGPGRGGARQHRVEEALAAKLDPDVEALESAHHLARLRERAARAGSSGRAGSRRARARDRARAACPCAPRARPCAEQRRPERRTRRPAVRHVEPHRAIVLRSSPGPSAADAARRSSGRSTERSRARAARASYAAWCRADARRSPSSESSAKRNRRSVSRRAPPSGASRSSSSSR